METIGVALRTLPQHAAFAAEAAIASHAVPTNFMRPVVTVGTARPLHHAQLEPCGRSVATEMLDLA